MFCKKGFAYIFFPPEEGIEDGWISIPLAPFSKGE